MRKPGIIIGVLVLGCAFAAAWFALGPTDATPQSPQFSDNNLHGRHDGDPLEAEHAALAGDTPDGKTVGERRADEPESESGHSRPAGFEAEGTTTSREAVSRATIANGAPIPRDAGGAPASGAGEAPALPFIKGHPRPPGQNLGSTRPAARALGSATGVKALSDVTPKLMQDRRGLYAQYFRLDEPDVSKLDTSSPDMVRIDRQVYFPDAEAFSDLPISLENFAAVWEGFLVIPEQGDYWLFWGADNGGRVELDGETVLLQDGMVRYVEVSAVLTLQPGLHPLRIEFAQTHNQVADWAKCAANFMWVPEGQTKPVPVPPEMLMVPEWMWSDNAPIITSLSKYEGEIGDEITIHGQGLDEEVEDTEYGYSTSVTFAGQAARVLEASPAALRVKVPIGARTGDVIVHKSPVFNPASLPKLSKLFQPHRGIPSNSARFKVTTQFGLMAEWHNLEGWSNFGPDDLDRREPEVVRLEPQLNIDKEAAVAAPFASASLGARFEFRLGVPKHSGKTQHEYILGSNSEFRLTLDGKLVPLDYPDGEFRAVGFELPCDKESFITVVIEWVSDSVEDRLLILTGELRSDDDDDEPGAYELLPIQYFFPPVVPPKPPEIFGVEAVWPEGEQPAAPPYDVNPERPTVAVGQEFKFLLTDYSARGEWGGLPTVSIDGFPVIYTVEKEIRAEDDSERELVCKATMPVGVGEGRMVARLSLVTSEPVFIDIANRGLVAYLYDFPDGSGLAKLPDLGPLTCFKVRKDRVINFESAADFDLPFPAETFVIEWLGGLIIEEEGDYTFTCRSDDGMKLWLDDNVVLDADKLQAPAENSATVHLVPGTYRFRMQFFENNQHEVCVLEWQASRGEGSALETIFPRAVIPARAFTLDAHPPFPAKTSTGKRTDGS